MKRFDVKGMSCAACSARVEKAVKNVDGVESCSVSLMTNSMNVEGTADEKAIEEAVAAAGYEAHLQDAEREGGGPAKKDTTGTNEFRAVMTRLICSAVLLIALMYVSMGRMAGLPQLPFLTDNALALGMMQLLLSAAVLVVNQKFFISGFKSILHRAPNMDALVSVGSGVAFIYSTWELFLMTGDGGERGLYFDSAAMIVTLVTVGKLLEARSKNKAADAIAALGRLTPDTAVIIENGEERTVPSGRVRIGDTFIVKAGGAVPADGVIAEGEAAVNESAMTGESIPADKRPGDAVSAGTVVMSGYVACKATAVGEETGISKIIRMVNDASATKAPISRLADKIASVFVPAVMALAALTAAVWLVCGADIGSAMKRGISVLVISCPCALGLATPVAVTVAGGFAAGRGILFRNAAAMEEMGRVKIIAMDKTGTVTEGRPEVTDIVPADGWETGEILKIARSVEDLSEHPLSRAVVDRAVMDGVEPYEITGFKTLSGSGVKAERKEDGITLCGGSESYISSVCSIPGKAVKDAERFSKSGKTPLLFACGGDYAGMIAVSDKIREDSTAAVSEFKALGIRTVLLTGDNEITARAVASEIHADQVIAGVKPDGKSDVVSRLREQGKTAMIGDGINDAPALMSADVGMAIGAGTDIAIDCADVVLVNSRLSDAAHAVIICRKTLRNIKQNLFWAFFYNVLSIPLAAGVFIPVLGWELSPAVGAAAMSLSSVCVVMNALRLNRIRLSANGKKNTLRKERKKKMKKTVLKIEGMMCEHCQARVKKALEETHGVSDAEVSYKSKTAVVEHDENVTAEELKKAVEAQGYKVDE